MPGGRSSLFPNPRLADIYSQNQFTAIAALAAPATCRREPDEGSRELPSGNSLIHRTSYALVHELYGKLNLARIVSGQRVGDAAEARITQYCDRRSHDRVIHDIEKVRFKGQGSLFLHRDPLDERD